MKKALMALVAMLVLGGGAGGAYFYFEHPAEAAIGKTDEHQAAKEAPAHDDSEGHVFVELDPLILPIIDSDGVNQVVSMVVVIEAKDDKAGSKIEKFQPRLKDAYIQELYGVLNMHAALRGGVVQVGMIKERLTAITNKVMGDDVVSDVLLQVVQQRPI